MQAAIISLTYYWTIYPNLHNQKFCTEMCAPSLSPAAEAAVTSRLRAGSGLCPFFRCTAVLSIPSVLIVPTVDEFQQAVNSVVQCILEVFRTIPLWSIVNNIKEHSPTVPGTSRERSRLVLTENGSDTTIFVPAEISAHTEKGEALSCRGCSIRLFVRHN